MRKGGESGVFERRGRGKCHSFIFNLDWFSQEGRQRGRDMCVPVLANSIALTRMSRRHKNSLSPRMRHSPPLSPGNNEGQTSSVVDEAVSLAMTREFLSSGHSYVDTARIYAGGATEKVLGTVLRSLSPEERSGAKIGTKAHPSQPGGLSPVGMRRQLLESLDAMGGQESGMTSVGEFYLHQPDPDNPLLESLRCADELVREGRIASVGLSNYHESEVRRAFELCDEFGLTRPTVYQGLYNPLNRMVECDLLPLLREYGCSFVAYNPLAAGLLTGKHRRKKESGDGTTSADVVEKVAKGRFRDNPNYLPRFYTDVNFRAVDVIQCACVAAGLNMVEATYTWLLRHSALASGENGGDGVLLGASSTGQLQQNLAGCELAAIAEVGDLPNAVLDAFDAAWKMTEEAGAFPYWRSYSSDMPGREELDHGASYSAAARK